MISVLIFFSAVLKASACNKTALIFVPKQRAFFQNHSNSQVKAKQNLKILFIKAASFPFSHPTAT